MSIKVWKVSSLGQYYDVVTEINREIASSEDGQVNTLWFRAESRVIFSLIPSLLRTNEMESAPSVLKEQYTSLHYKEDIRTQHYQAKKLSLFSKRTFITHRMAGGYAASWSKNTSFRLV